MSVAQFRTDKPQANGANMTMSQSKNSAAKDRVVTFTLTLKYKELSGPFLADPKSYVANKT